MVADIKQAGDAELLHAILARADVFIQNLAPGAAARAGFASEALRAAHPRLVTVDISGYGDTPECASLKAYDLLVQAESGLASITGVPSAPGRVGVSVCDIACGMSAHAAALEALLERQRTGRGCGLKVSLFDAIADWMSVPLLQFEATGGPPARVGLAHPSICPYGAFSTRDGRQIVIAIQNEREWRQFCENLLEQPLLVTRRGYESNVSRVHNRAEVDALIAAAFAQLDYDSAVQKLRRANTAYAHVNDVAALARHPALRRVTVETPAGAVSFAAPPAVSSGKLALGSVPGLGAHSAQIRAEFAKLRQ